MEWLSIIFSSKYSNLKCSIFASNARQLPLVPDVNTSRQRPILYIFARSLCSRTAAYLPILARNSKWS